MTYWQKLTNQLRPPPFLFWVHSTNADTCALKLKVAGEFSGDQQD